MTTMAATSAFSARVSAIRDESHDASAARLRTWSHVALILLATVAAVLRLIHLGEPSLTHAEAWRANWSYTADSDQIRRLPPLQFVMLWTLQHLFAAGEFGLRMPSACAGILCVCLLFRFAQREWGLIAALIAGLFAAVHPVLLEQSRVLKVFSIEALFTVILLTTGLRACRDGTRRAYLIFLASALLGLGFTFSASFLAAAWIPLLARSQWRKSPAPASPPSMGTQHSRSTRGTLVVVAAALAAAAIACYIWFSGAACRGEVADYYFGTVEPVWPPSYAAQPLVAWLLSSTVGAVKYTLGAAHLPLPHRWIFTTVCALAVAAAIPNLWRHHRPLLLAIAGMLLIAMLAGTLRLYPFGEIRTMTHAVPAVVLIVGFGLAVLVQSLKRSPATALLLAFCVGIPTAYAVPAALRTPPPNEHIRPVFDYVDTHRADNNALFIYYPVDEAYAYYRRGDQTPALVQPRTDRGDTAAFAQRFDDWIATHRRVWFIFAHPWSDERELWLEHLQVHYELADHFAIGDASAHLFVTR